LVPVPGTHVDEKCFTFFSANVAILKTNWHADIENLSQRSFKQQHDSASVSSLLSSFLMLSFSLTYFLTRLLPEVTYLPLPD